MARTTGHYENTIVAGETARAFVPVDLPPSAPDVDPAAYIEQNDKAERALARLSGLSGLAPSTGWLVYTATLREALLTSQMEGIRVTLTDVLDAEAGFEVTNAEEITSYLQALLHGRSELRSSNGLPPCMRLLNSCHNVLMGGGRSSNKTPGAVRALQNWIGGTRLGNAKFIPPPPHLVPQALEQMVLYIRASDPALPPLVRVALVHAQFETIHPYSDGNGRIGRLLIALLLEHWKLIPEPLLYVSGYLKRHKDVYYECLSRIRSNGNWEGWISFFLEAVEKSADEARYSIVTIAKLIADDRRRVLESARSTPATLRLFEMLPTMPSLSIEKAACALEVSLPTATRSIHALQDAKILREVTGRLRSRKYRYEAYAQLLST